MTPQTEAGETAFLRLNALVQRGYVPTLGAHTGPHDAIFLDHPKDKAAPSVILYPNGLVVETRPHENQMRIEPEARKEFGAFLHVIPKPNWFQAAMSMRTGQFLIAAAGPVLFVGVVIGLSEFFR